MTDDETAAPFVSDGEPNAIFLYLEKNGDPDINSKNVLGDTDFQLQCGGAAQQPGATVPNSPASIVRATTAAALARSSASRARASCCRKPTPMARASMAPSSASASRSPPEARAAFRRRSTARTTSVCVVALRRCRSIRARPRSARARRRARTQQSALTLDAPSRWRNWSQWSRFSCICEAIEAAFFFNVFSSDDFRPENLESGMTMKTEQKADTTP